MAESGTDVDLSHLHQDIAATNEMRKAVSEKSGEMREEVKDRVERRGYNKKAFSTLAMIERMSPEKRADFRRTFEAGYETLSEKWDQSDSADMFDESRNEGAEQPDAA